MAPALKRRRLAAYDEDLIPTQRSSRRDRTIGQSQDDDQSLPKGLQITTQTPQMLQLKVDELLAEAENSHHGWSDVESAVHMLKDLIWKIPNSQSQSVSTGDKYQGVLKAAIPFDLPVLAESLKYQLEYARPDVIDIVGRGLDKIHLKGDEIVSIDIFVGMPDSLFQVKDFLNYRYFHKRAFYLAWLASGIRANIPGNFDLRYSYHDDNPLTPVLLVQSNLADSGINGKGSYCVSMYPRTTNPELFLNAKTLPGRTCLTIGTNSTLNPGGEFSNFYNSCVRADCVRNAYHSLIDSLMAESKAYRASCALGKIWLRQRGLESSLSGGGFGAFEWSLVTAFLFVQSQQDVRSSFAQGYTSFQMFKAVLQFLGSKDLVRAHYIVRCSPSSKKPDLDSIVGPIFFDCREGLNILYKMSTSSYGVLRHLALCSSRSLSDPLIDQFQMLFIRKSSLKVYQYNMMIQLPLRGILPKTEVDLEVLWLFLHTRDALYQLLRKGLGDRVSLIEITLEKAESWDITSKGLGYPNGPIISIYLMFNSQFVNRAIDKGPPVEAKADADDFRSLWGEKAELRRFHDGSILEVVVWPTWSTKGRSIISQIVTHLLNTHIVPDSVNSFVIFEAGEEVRLSEETGLSNQVPSYQSLVESFEKLERKLRDFKDLPLQILQISPVDPKFYHMSVGGLQKKQNTRNFVRPANVTVQFEVSTRWPNSLAALQRSKIAFLLKIGELLESSDSGVSTYVGFEDQWNFSECKPFLDVHGFESNAFRLRLHVNGEEDLVRRELQSTIKSSKEREVTAQALSRYKRDYIQRPRHAQAMKAAMTRYQAFAPSVRLLKEWRDRHLLSNHLGDELLELLAIRTFVHPDGYSVPGSALTAFYLTLLVISRWDWRSQPYIVDFSGELSRDGVAAITTHFEAWRRIDPAMSKVVMFAASNLDPEGVTWTASNPSIVAAARFTSLAKAATACVQAEGHRLPPSLLFTVNLEEYDFVMHLQTNAIQQMPHQNGRPHNLQFLDPNALFLKELDQLYSDSITFFYNQSNLRYVGGLWKPNAKARGLNIQKASPGILSQEGNQNLSTVPNNRTTIINEMAKIGCEMIQDIKV